MLHNEAMIVRLTISKWTARKFDKAVTATATAQYGADKDSGRFNKVLIAKDAIQEVDRAASAARQYHYENTLPWDDHGGRLLPSKNFADYSQKMRELRQEFDSAANEFLQNYNTYREEAKLRLGDMFDPSDYPQSFELSDKFGFESSIEPVPHGQDFRVSLQEKDKEELSKALEETNSRRTERATRDLFQRLADVTQRFVEKLSDPDAIFRDSLVENAVELVNLLPKLNINNDPELEKIRKEVSKKLAQHEPDNLRKDKTIRAKAAKDAQSILDKMSGFVS